MVGVRTVVVGVRTVAVVVDPPLAYSAFTTPPFPVVIKPWIVLVVLVLKVMSSGFMPVKLGSSKQWGSLGSHAEFVWPEFLPVFLACLAVSSCFGAGLVEVVVGLVEVVVGLVEVVVGLEWGFENVSGGGLYSEFPPVVP